MPSFDSSNQGKQCQSPLDLNRMAQVIEQLSPTDKARPCTVHDPAGLVHRTNIDRMILRIPPQESPKEPISFSQLISVPVSHRLAGEEAILGKGTYGVVKLMMDKTTRQRYAVKYLDQRIVKSTGMESQVQLEIMAQTLVEHPNVVKCWNVVGDRDYIYLILEYCQNGDLFKKLRTAPGRRLKEKAVFRYFVQLVSGLAHIHNLGLCHRDLKLENLLLDANNNLKIADFGWATRINGYRKNFNFCGTLDYLSPEMIRGQGHDWRIDIWAVGVLLYELLMGKPPFLSTRHYDLLDRILNVKIHDSLNGPTSSLRTRKRWMQPDALEAVKAFLQPNPKIRISMEDIFGLRWVQRMISELYAEYLLTRPLSNASNIIHWRNYGSPLNKPSQIIEDNNTAKQQNVKQTITTTEQAGSRIPIVKPIRTRLRSDESLAFKNGGSDMISAGELLRLNPRPVSHEDGLVKPTSSLSSVSSVTESISTISRPRHLRKVTYAPSDRLELVGIQNPGVQNPGVQNHGIQSPGVQNHGIQSPGVQSPGVQSPGVQSPGVRRRMGSMGNIGRVHAQINLNL